MIYLTEKDIRLYFEDQHIYDQIVKCDTEIIDKAEAIAVEDVRSCLELLYDTDDVFRPIDKYDASKEYCMNDRVLYKGKHYLYINETPATGIVLTDVTYWENKDTRDSILCDLILRIFRYKICQRIVVRNIPPFWFDDYQLAKEDLMNIKKGNKILRLTRRTDENGEEKGKLFYVSNKVSRLTY